MPRAEAERRRPEWPRRYPLAQWPNAPLWIFIVGRAAEWVLHGRAEGVARAIAVLALCAWAWLELSGGANAFRRLLGAVVLVFLVVELSGKL